jgi:prepilin-type N-terminal cleavage/methylation domain-containing protein
MKGRELPPQIFPLRRSSGFSLLELLLAISIMLLLMGLAVPALRGLGRSASLNVSGNELVNLLNLARQNSISRNTMTALVVLADGSMEQSHRAVTLLELAPSAERIPGQTATWRQIHQWKVFGAGVLIDPRELQLSDSAVVSGPGSPRPPLPTLEYGGQTVNRFKYLIFLPGGNLLSGTPAHLQLAEGYLPRASETPVYTRAEAGVPANYVAITVLDATGRMKVDRP